MSAFAGDEGGSISISCPGVKAELSLFSNKVALVSVDNQEMEKQAGDTIAENLYVSYIGQVPSKVKGDGGKNFIVLVNPSGNFDIKAVTRINSLIEEIQRQGKDIELSDFETRIKSSAVGGTFAAKSKAFVILEGGEQDVKYKVGNSEQTVKVKFNELKQIKNEDKVKENEELENYFNLSVKTVEQLIDEFPQERNLQGRFGEAALWDEIVLARDLEKIDKQTILLRKFIETYPDSAFIKKARDDLDIISKFDVQNSGTTLYVNNEFHSVNVLRFNPLNPEDKRIFINVGGSQGYFLEGAKIGLGSGFETPGAKEDYIIVEKITAKDVKFNYFYYPENKDGVKQSEIKQGASFSLKEEEVKQGLGRNIALKTIEINAVAYVSIIPVVKNTKTEADFTFKIGIEKRGIELSTDKTKEMIKNLNETIQRWEEINKKLSNLINSLNWKIFDRTAWVRKFTDD